MTKKDYQALARVIHAHTFIEANEVRPWLTRATIEASGFVEALADVFAADSPRFDRARFLEACETGACKGMPRRV